MASDKTKIKIRTTFQPDVEIEVEEAERLDLERQGLIHEGTKTEGRQARRAASGEEE
ncbi:MAG TPA: hypothetical protein VFP10_12385 [Candidatus Eisenbacteria bacterium]|nr:hypothetical protein [Candidatus Eisenbacteria bacterium]